jgi:ABC-type branched-subunit amino acid transport system substrate-binding protein
MLLGLALCLPALAAWSQGVTPRTVVLGQSAPLSGPLKSVGEDLRSGALAYLRKLNDAGGVHGRRLELATLDDGGEPARALANTRRLIEEFRVFALLAYADASLTREVLALVQQSRIPLLGAATGAASARPPGRGVFSIRASRADEAEQLVGHYALLGLRRFALVRRDDAAGAEFLAGARDALSSRGLAPPADIMLLGDADGLAGAARDAFMADAQVVVVALPQPPAADLIREIRRGGSGAQIVALSTSDPEALAKALGTAGAGIALTQVVPPLAQVSLPIIPEYRAALQAETGRAAHAPGSLEAYIAAKVFAESVRRAGPALSRDALWRALDAMSFYDAGGYTVTFSRNRRQGSSRIYLMAIGQDGKLLH